MMPQELSRTSQGPSKDLPWLKNDTSFFLSLFFKLLRSLLAPSSLNYAIKTNGFSSISKSTFFSFWTLFASRNRPKIDPLTPKENPRDPKVAPRSPQGSPRRPPRHPQRTQGSPQGPPGTSPRVLKGPTGDPKAPQGPPRTPKGSIGTFEGPKNDEKSSKINKKLAQSCTSC